MRFNDNNVCMVGLVRRRRRGLEKHAHFAYTHPITYNCGKPSVEWNTDFHFRTS